MSDVTIKIKRSLTPGNTPADLSLGELAVNIPDRKIFIGDNSTDGITLIVDGNATGGAGNPFGNDTELQFNNAGSFGSSSKLTWQDSATCGSGCTTSYLELKNIAGIKLYEATSNGTNYISFLAPSALSANTHYRFPGAGTAGQLLSIDSTSNGQCTLSWITAFGVEQIEETSFLTLTSGAFNKVTITQPATAATLTIGNNKTFTVSNTLSFSGTDSSSIAFGTGGTVAYTSDKLSAFAATTSSELAGIISDETGTGSLVFGTSPTFTTGVTTGSTTFSVFNTTATTISAFGAATTLSMGAITGTTSIRNPTLRVGNTNGSVVANGGTLTLSGGSTIGSPNGSTASLSIDYAGEGEGLVTIAGGNLYLSNKSTSELTVTPVNIIFEGTTANDYETTLTVTDPTADRTITLPNISGTVITTGDTGTVTNTMLAGSIANDKLLNSAITVNGSSISLGGSATVTATTTNALTLSTGLTGTSYNGSTAVTAAVDTSIIATKSYVDSLAQGLHIHSTAKVASTAKLATLTGTTVSYAGGAITWTGGTAANAAGGFTDGVVLTANTTEASASRILIKNEGDVGGLGASKNGTYYVYGARELRRTADGDTAAEWFGGDFCFVSEGTSYNNTGWIQTEVVTNLDTDSILWEQFSGAGTYTADEVTLTKSGSQFAIKNTYAGQNSIVTLGTVTTGTWNASTITTNKGGTGLTSFTANGAVYASDSSTLTTGTLPVTSGGTGITSFGSGIGTWLGTPSSANLAAAISDETGTGSLVFGTSPTFTTGVTTGSTTFSVFNTTATTVNAFGAATTLTMGATSNATTTIRGGTLVGNTATQDVFNTTATTVNAFGAAGSIYFGRSVGSCAWYFNSDTSAVITNFQDNIPLSLTSVGSEDTATLTVSGSVSALSASIALNATIISTNKTDVQFFNTGVTGLSIGGAATTFTLGYSGSSTSTTNIATGTLNTAQTKTINIGTGNALITRITNINIGTGGGSICLGSQSGTYIGGSDLLTPSTLFVDSIQNYSSAISISSSGSGVNIDDIASIDIGDFSSNGDATLLTVNDGLHVVQVYASSGLQLKTESPLRFYDSNNSNYVGFKASATVAADIMWTLPSADGTSGQVLSTDGSGTLSWISSSSAPPDYLLFDMGIV